MNVKFRSIHDTISSEIRDQVFKINNTHTKV